MVATLDQASAPPRPRGRRRFTVLDAPISIGPCDSCRFDELVLRKVRDVTDANDVATFDLCRRCAPARA